MIAGDKWCRYGSRSRSRRSCCVGSAARTCTSSRRRRTSPTPAGSPATPARDPLRRSRPRRRGSRVRRCSRERRQTPSRGCWRCPWRRWQMSRLLLLFHLLRLSHFVAEKRTWLVRTLSNDFMYTFLFVFYWFRLVLILLFLLLWSYLYGFIQVMISLVFKVRYVQRLNPFQVTENMQFVDNYLSM